MILSWMLHRVIITLATSSSYILCCLCCHPTLFNSFTLSFSFSHLILIASIQFIQYIISCIYLVPLIKINRLKEIFSSITHRQRIRLQVRLSFFVQTASFRPIFLLAPPHFVKQPPFGVIFFGSVPTHHSELQITSHPSYVLT